MCYNTPEDKMSKTISPDRQAEAKRDRLRNRIIPTLTLLLIIAISVSLFVYGRNPDRLAELEKYRYFGAFLISLIGNATILLPGIALSILTALGVGFYQASGELAGLILIGLAGGAGAALGETVGYIAGYSGQAIVRKQRIYARVESWVKKWGTLAIFLFALVPLFFDLVGLAAGALRFPLPKFLLACWLGRTLLYVAFLVLAALGWEVVLPYLG